LLVSHLDILVFLTMWNSHRKCRDSAPHSRPYMASLQIQGRPNCGGVLVREDFVLTAAHCAVPLQYTVVVGVNSLSGNEATKQELTAVRSFPHPNYDGHANDIMLLKLNSKVQLTEAVQLIALKTGRINVATQCLTVGWGDIGDNNTLARTLQEVNVTTLNVERKKISGSFKQRTPTVKCLVSSFLKGDSGGPLVCDGATAGVVSFSGRKCGDSKTPDVYTRISSFREWIRSVLNNN
uniref:trypsin n=1 Tax=Lates calcarifer TaxID=8187 RepID=A0A4W6BYT5_LATCA